MIFKIKITYQTGDSFRSGIENQCLDGSWNNIEVIKQNLQNIKDHYSWYLKKEDRYMSKKEKAALVVPVCVVFTDKYDNDGSIKLYTDFNAVYIIRPFWIGYFEKLISISAEVDLSELKYEF